ncbi:MAG TPA: RES domain-containing protein [Pyrinomonadaceae bacterium]|jgi:hypothetical protein
MSGSLGLSTTVLPTQPYFRITSPSPTYYTGNPADYPNIVNGKGAFRSLIGGRYNYRATTTVYLTENVETCFAEKMFYFHRETLRKLDALHITGSLVPLFTQRFILWEIYFANAVDDVFDMNIAGAASYFGIFPCMSLNPSQDYDHLRDKRGIIEVYGYKGLRVASSRAVNGGNMVVLFEGQSSNVRAIMPCTVEFRLVNDAGTPFTNHAHEILDFTSGEVRITSGYVPHGAEPYQQWTKVNFNH